LQALLAGASPRLRDREHIVGSGPDVLRAARVLGAEGVVSKGADERYVPGNRGIWVKSKCLNRQEFVVVGWSDPEGSRTGLGSLLLGDHDDDGRLVYAGRAGTGMRVVAWTSSGTSRRSSATG
jgi:ATP-dependent DNA ligase